MPADASDPPTPPEVVVGHVAVGRYVLALGAPAGMAIEPVASEDKPGPLAQAIARSLREREQAPTGAASLEGALEDASQVMDKAERAVKLFTDIAQARLDPAAISKEVDAMVGLLRRLDRDERWGEALRFTRSLAMLLALLGRWIELLQSLRVALSAAEQLGDAGGKAWVLHELGTLNLAAEKHADADRLLSEAHDLREHIGDRDSLAMTDRNLRILCRALRARLHPPPRRSVLEEILRRPALALVFGILLLIVGGVAGAVIGSPANSTESTSSSPAAVEIDFTPKSPHVGDHVAFHATVEGTTNPAHYAWRFGDGIRATTANPTHVYEQHRTYTAKVTVSDTHGTTIGRATRSVHVHSSPTPETTTTETTPIGPTPTGPTPKPANQTLSVTEAGTGSGTITSSDEQINCSAACTHPYTRGTAVTLTAAPAAGSTFTGWSGACSGTGTCQLPMEASESVVANFTTAGGE